jgi:hypothetical protein
LSELVYPREESLVAGTHAFEPAEASTGPRHVGQQASDINYELVQMPVDATSELIISVRMYMRPS